MCFSIVVVLYEFIKVFMFEKFKFDWLPTCMISDSKQCIRNSVRHELKIRLFRREAYRARRQTRQHSRTGERTGHSTLLYNPGDVF